MTINRPTPDARGVSVVIGASHGIGLAIAARLAAGGRRVVALARSFDDAPPPEGVVALECDLTRSDQILAAIEQVHRDGRQVDVLVNNAGLYMEGPFASSSMAEAADLVRVNVTGLIQMTHACLPDLLQTRGTIVNMATRNVQRAEDNQAVYSATKFAVKGFSDSLRLELRGSGVRITTLYPGPVDTWGAETSDMLLPGDVAEIVRVIVDSEGRIEVGEMSFD